MIHRLLCTICLILLTSLTGSAQWQTTGGNSQRNGYSANFGGIVGQNHTGQSISALFGSQVYSDGAKLVVMRFQTLDYSPIVCHDAITMDTLWTLDFPGSNSRSLPVGFRDGKIYAVNFRESGFDTLYALNPSNGAIIWRAAGYLPIAGINYSCAYASNGDLLLPESGARVMRINHLTGQKVWSTPIITPNSSSQTLSTYGNTVYSWTGTIVTPKQLVALDINTGAVKYSSPELPGDGDQESTPSIGHDGTIYCLRDGGMFYALTDNQSSIQIKWAVNLPGTPSGILPGVQFGIASDNSIYVPLERRLARLNPQTGAITDSSAELTVSNTFQPRITIANNGTVYVSNGSFADGALYSLTPTLATNWSSPVAGINNSGPAVVYGGIVVAGSGVQLNKYSGITGITSNSSEIQSYRLEQNFPNPFNPSTKIRFSISKNGFTTLKVYDISGREVRTLINSEMNMGNHEINFDASDLGAGVYFYKLTTGGFTETKKMILVK